MSDVAIKVQKIIITDTRDVQITDVVEVAGDGSGSEGYIRSIRFLGEPIQTNGEGTLLLEVQVKSNTRSDILVDAPGTSY